MNQTETLHLLANHTPFHKNESDSFQLENKNKNCSYYEIDRLIHHKIINTIDFEIMELLYQYDYLNHFLIMGFLNNTPILSKEDQKPDYKKNLRKLTHAGILLRYLLTDSSHKTGALRCYCLSPKACSYMGRLLKKKLTHIYNTSQILELLSLNQLYLNLQQYYLDIIIQDPITKPNNMPFLFSIFQLKLVTGINPLQNRFYFFTLSFRYGMDIKGQFLYKMNTLQYWIHQSHFSSIILILAEDMEMVKLLYPLSKALNYKEPIYYVLDCFSATVPILQNLLDCIEREGHLIIQNVSLLEF